MALIGSKPPHLKRPGVADVGTVDMQLQRHPSNADIVAYAVLPVGRQTCSNSEGKCEVSHICARHVQWLFDQMAPSSNRPIAPLDECDGTAFYPMKQSKNA